VKEQRYRRFMEKSQAISARLLKRKVGKRLPIIIDEAGGGALSPAAKGRTKGDAPEIDGAVHVTSHRPLRAGDIVSVKVERADAYDLFGTAS
jgi:ribosomal protein S12 methylthiotransferase